MPQVWPFKPLQELIESLEWLTDVIRTKESEQRFALRDSPRRYLNINHLLNEQEYSAARAIIRAADNESDFLVPDWTIRAYPGHVEPGTSVVIEFEQTDLNLNAGDLVILWESSSRFESITIDEVTSDEGIIAEVVGEYTNPTLMPLKNAAIPQGISSQRTPAKFISISFMAEIIDGIDLGQSNLTQYRGRDLLTQCPIVGGGEFSEPIQWTIQQIDNSIGVPDYLRDRDIPDARFMMRWHEFARESINLLRLWIYSRRGRWKSFWLSSWGADLLPASSIGASDLIIRVFKLPGINGVGKTNFDIEINTITGASHYVQVIDVNTGPLIGGQESLVLTISSAIGSAIALPEIKRISFLRLVRFDADRVEFVHRASSGVSVAVPCIEVTV